jgi:lytic murein transglycosylase
LARFETLIRFVNHVKTATTAHNTTIPVPILQRFERVTYFHFLGPFAAFASIFKGKPSKTGKISHERGKIGISPPSVNRFGSFSRKSQYHRKILVFSTNSPKTTGRIRFLWQIGNSFKVSQMGRGNMSTIAKHKLRGLLLGAAFAISGIISVPALAQVPDDVPTKEEQAAFQAWLKDFRKQARKSGISKQTINASLSDLSLNPRVLYLNDFQPEFSKPVWDYLDGAVSENRITKGKALLSEHGPLLKEVQNLYGVPPRYIVAIWGMETSFGALTGGFNALEALATLGYQGKRAKFGRTQLMAALEIVENGDKPADAMTGSWAGAMGQTQFIPTTYMTYAVDHNGDGTRDIWANLGDVFASTSNYLSASGWQPGQTWGREVVLPEGFDFALADRNKKLTLKEWAGHGLKFTNGDAIPGLDRHAAVIAPAGHQGPAFLIFDNFRSILRYNNSTSYALAVSLLADQLIDGDGVSASWPRHEKALSREERLEFQQRLTGLGYDTKGVDGILGANSRRALRDFQRANSAVPDGFATAAWLEKLRAAKNPTPQTSAHE